MSVSTEKDFFEIIGNNHQMTSTETPIRPDAFLKADKDKIASIEKHFFRIMEEIGLNMEDDSLKGTPHRVAKMFIQELFSGLHPDNKPKLSVFDNIYSYKKMLVETDISFNSTCEHHFLPIFGKAHIGYVPGKNVIGLSKLNRIVDYYSRRPQVQERLTMQIFNELKTALGTEDVIVVMEAKHLCVSGRGINDESSLTSTIQYAGSFNDKENRDDFFHLVASSKI